MFHIELSPGGLKVSAREGNTVLECLRLAGIDIVIPCEGKGICGKCIVNVIDSHTSESKPVLACKTKIQGNLTISLPKQSFFAPGKISGNPERPLAYFLPHDENSDLSAPLVGLAIDFGTTGVAGYLIDMGTGATLAAEGIMNPQIPYGDDVVSRLAFSKINNENARILQKKAIEAIELLMTGLCHKSGYCNPNEISNIAVVCNTAMHHILLNANIQKLVCAPYTPSIHTEIISKALELGISVSPDAEIFIPPPVAGFIGSDHVAMLLATGAHESSENVLAVDIGTNTEISLISKGKITSVSCASGGAIEGSNISCGVCAIEGAIDHLGFDGSKMEYHTINNAPPIGICGSGIFDLLAHLIKNGIIDSDGKLNENCPDVRNSPIGREFMIINPGETAKLSLSITQSEIRAFQLAKAAIRTGIQVLLLEAGLKDTDLSQIIVSGAFGSFIDISSAISVRMLPDVPLECYQQVGNAAGIGAKYILFSDEARKTLDHIRKKIRHIDLVSSPNFKKVFLSELSF